MAENVYYKTIGRFRLSVEPNNSGLNRSRVVIHDSEMQDVKARFTVEELHDLHYVTGRAIAALELEQK